MTQNYRKHSGYPLWVFLCQFYANSMSILCLYKICVFLTRAWPPPLLNNVKKLQDVQVHRGIPEKEVDAKLLTPDQLLGKPWNILGITVQMSYVEGRWRQN